MIKSIANSYEKELENTAPKPNKDFRSFLVDTGLNILGKKIKKGLSKFWGFRNISNENKMTHIIKAIRSSENRGILLKGTTKKFNSQKGGLLNFLAPLMKVGLPLMKNLITPLARFWCP